MVVNCYFLKRIYLLKKLIWHCFRTFNIMRLLIASLFITAFVFSFTRADKEELYQHLRKEYKRMEEQRMDGITGRLEFTNIWFE